LTSPSFTEESANAAIEVAERHVMSLQRFINQAKLDPKKADCRLNWGMPEKPDVEALLPMLVNIARDRPDIISAKEFRKILVAMGLALEKAESGETKSVTM